MPSMNDLEAKCGGCKKTIDQENGGVVVAFGASLWHVDCFKCAKCLEKVSADTNLLLLSDGSPVCGKCSYQCFVCKQAITEEAIMTGDESYHAHCFTCRTCKQRIEELVFAKTSQGIYCMNCHNERVARSRRHAEARRLRAARKEREKEESEARRRDASGIRSSSTSTSLNLLTTVASNVSVASSAVSPSSPRYPDVTSPTNLSSFAGRDAGPLSGTASPATGPMRNHSVPASPAGPREPRETAMARGGSQDSRTPRSGNVSPTPGSSSKTSPMALSQSQSQPAGNLLSQASPRSPTGPPSGPRSASGVGLGVSGLSVPTSRAEKRRSINPGLSFNMDQAASAFTPEPRVPSPLPKSSPKSETTSGTRAQTATAETTPKSSEPSQDGHKSPSAFKPSVLPPERKDSHMSTNGDAALPRIDAPGLLPTMSFSLSDPDFAVLLNEMETPEGSKALPKKARTPESGSAQVSDGDDAAGGAMSRNLNMDSLVTAANGEAITPSSSRTLLSPNDQPSPVDTLRRRGSKDSILSVRMERDSSFQALAALVAGLKPDDDNRVSIDYSLLIEAIREHSALKEAADTLKAKYTGAKRSSQQYSDGLAIAGEEYDKESQRRRELETEIVRLRSQLHGQSARLSLMSSDERRQERLNRHSQDLASNLTGLEHDISRLRAQRDISLAEIEELQSKRGEIDSEEATSKLGRSLSRRLEKIKEEYRDELAPLSAQREALQREIADLESTKEQYIEEASSLQAKNDEIIELNQQLMRQNEGLNDRRSPAAFPVITKARGHPSGSPSMSSLATALEGVPEESKETARVIKVSKPEPIEVTPARRFKWIGKAAKAVDTDKLTVGGSGGDRRKLRPSTEVGTREHHFAQHSTMRLGRCDLCQDKMWGLQEVKCSACGMVCHQKCAEKLPKSCPGKGAKVEDEGPLPPSMFGRELSDQSGADNAAVPVIVTKCIRAVEANGMEYEGIYRKTGGNAQCKQITQLFERGKYETFDLTNADDFNDISAITSVLKNYFRNLPDPVFTHKLHESFIAAANIRGVDNKKQALCALLQELPKAHYDTLKVLMLHLNRVTAKSDINLMTSQNLGVVFGPTLLRSSDPNREFGDMAGKALSVQWMVENAPSVFLEERE
ncbi:uncharacterized protein CcaverHIS019_0702950 [Cutaneotrichosporon cavernicola]|uniref:RhoGAP-domain-containing protein n=1 Tax=Cutaneotrichosporon cavernicola TaxID=279322 RepID=A0AA48L9Y4_9TREE|nr:uncharacterized protein CcaverHIS019_0702950 [Cutaneotrichosporon cavernicola]BEI94714.1 hypothetical protein CcaverHIS019_0702950 [Cutaneotrichosporon cavernicola]BEJ02489.1 hypothetical protein CcaverHIS631_0702840 [Cutaneotrichosporon cavernicola]